MYPYIQFDPSVCFKTLSSLSVAIRSKEIFRTNILRSFDGASPVGCGVSSAVTKQLKKAIGCYRGYVYAGN
jgi:hypothetical protein